MQGTIELHTRRLLLRRLRPDDAPVLYEHFGRDERMREFTGWNPYATEAMAEAAVETSRTERNRRRPPQPPARRRIICSKGPADLPCPKSPRHERRTE